MNAVVLKNKRRCFFENSEAETLCFKQHAHVHCLRYGALSYSGGVVSRALGRDGILHAEISSALEAVM